MKKILFFVVVVGSFFIYSVNTLAYSVYTKDINDIKEDEIISEYELRDGCVVKEDIYRVVDSPFLIVNKYYEKDDYYVIVGSNAISYSDGIMYPYISIYKGNSQIFSKTISGYGEGEIINCIFEDNNIIILGMGSSSEKENNKFPFVIRMNYNGDILNSEYYESNGNTYPFEIYKYYHTYVIVGTTSSSDKYFILNKDNSQKIFLMSIDNDFKEIDTNLIGNTGGTELLDICDRGDNFFMYCYLSGEGYFQLGGLKERYAILTCSKRGEFIDYYLINYKNGSNQLMKIGKEVYYINKKNLDIDIEFYKVDNDNMTYEFSLQTVYKMTRNVSIKVCEYKNKMLIFEEYYQNSKRKIAMTYYENKIKIFQSIEDVEGNVSLQGVFLSEKRNVIYYSKDDSLYIQNILYIKLFEDFCQMNSDVIIGKKQAVSETIYGLYDSFIVYEYGTIRLYLYDIYKVEPIISVKNNEIYDINLIINSNGKCRINNVEIENGYVIKDEGIYIIELNGVNCKEYYNIEVKKISKKLEKKEETILDINERKYQKNENALLSFNIIEEKNSSISKDYSLIVLIGISLVGVFIGLLSPVILKKRGKKDV